MKRHHLNRLLRLADKLEGKGAYEAVGPIPTHKFDLSSFYQERRGAFEEPICLADFNPHQCKTAACAVGWAATDPWFTDKLPLSEFQGSWRPSVGSWSRELFDLGQIAWERLFQRDDYGARNPTPRDVAKRIRKFVAEHI